MMEHDGTPTWQFLMVDASNSFAQSSRLSFHQQVPLAKGSQLVVLQILLTRLEIELTKIIEMDSS